MGFSNMPEVQFDTSDDIIKMIIDQLGDLPTAPLVLSKALKLTADVQSNIEDISNSIASDQTLTAKVIRMSNSPVYGRMQEISSLSEAITVLGFNEVKSIIVTASTAQMFQSGPHAKIANILWEHSLACAIGARIIASKYGGVDKEEAYLCGLLHDIGKLVMLQSAPDVYDAIIATVKETGSPFLKVEVKLLGYNHVQVGQMLLTKWRFPTPLVSQISGHHSITIGKPQALITLKGIIALADSIAKYIGAGFFEAYIAEKENICFVGDKFIETEDLISLRIEIEERFNQEMNCFYD